MQHTSFSFVHFFAPYYATAIAIVIVVQLINIYFHDEDKCLFISYLIKTFLLSLSNQRPPAQLKRIYDLCSNAFGHCALTQVHVSLL